MLLIFGAAPKNTNQGAMALTCYRCRQCGPHRVVKKQNGVSLFFVPVARFNTKYELTCSTCGASSTLTKDEAASVGID